MFLFIIVYFLNNIIINSVNDNSIRQITQNSVSSMLKTYKHANSLQKIKLNQTSLDPFLLVTDLNNRNLRKYFVNSTYYAKQIQTYQWRKKLLKPMPRIIINNNQIFQTGETICILSDHIVKYLSQMQNLNIDESVSFLKQMISAYENIICRLGYVCIQSQFIGVDSNGEIIVWISKNLSMNCGQSVRLQSEYQIIAKAIALTFQKCKQKAHPFYKNINFVQPKFKSIKAFISDFQQKYQAKKCFKNSSPRRNLYCEQVKDENMPKLDKNCNNQLLNSIKSTNQIQRKINNQRVSQIAKNPQIIYNTQVIRHDISNSQMISPITQSQFIDPKNNLKVNFSYSQKRKEPMTPINRQHSRYYTSQNNFGLSKISQPSRIQQFILDDKKSNILKQSRLEGTSNVQKKLSNKRNYKIVRQYSLYYLPSANLFIIKQRQDLQKKNRLLQLGSRSEYSLNCSNYNKTSMTTNPQTQKNSRNSNSLMKNSSESDQIIPKLLNMTSSNNCTFNQKGFATNFYSHIQQRPNQQKLSSKPQKIINTYTFGGLITVQQQEQNKKSRKSSSQQSSQNCQKPLKNNGAKSIQQLYNNLYFKEEERQSTIVQDSPTSHFKVDHRNKLITKQFGQLNLGGQPSFKMDAWRSIKGLLTQSRTDLKQSIHCGPQIRTPVNIKLQMLGKFGRDIGQSIIPNHN